MRWRAAAQILRKGLLRCTSFIGQESSRRRGPVFQEIVAFPSASPQSRCNEQVDTYDELSGH
jgi:hypothetical protein